VLLNLYFNLKTVFNSHATTQTSKFEKEKNKAHTITQHDLLMALAD